MNTSLVDQQKTNIRHQLLFRLRQLPTLYSIITSKRIASSLRSFLTLACGALPMNIYIYVLLILLTLVGPWKIIVTSLINPVAVEDQGGLKVCPAGTP